jgi:hypothetical protein
VKVVDGNALVGKHAQRRQGLSECRQGAEERGDRRRTRAWSASCRPRAAPRSRTARSTAASPAVPPRTRAGSGPRARAARPSPRAEAAARTRCAPSPGTRRARTPRTPKQRRWATERATVCSSSRAYHLHRHAGTEGRARKNRTARDRPPRVVAAARNAQRTPRALRTLGKPHCLVRRRGRAAREPARNARQSGSLPTKTLTPGGARASPGEAGWRERATFCRAGKTPRITESTESKRRTPPRRAPPTGNDETRC